MAQDYNKYTKEELIAMLQARDADTTDLEVIALKIEKLTEKYVELQRRSNEVLNIGTLSADERNMLSAALAGNAGEVQDKITKLKELQVKLSQP